MTVARAGHTEEWVRVREKKICSFRESHRRISDPLLM
jgi:hypothetical protein